MTEGWRDDPKSSLASEMHEGGEHMNWWSKWGKQIEAFRNQNENLKKKCVFPVQIGMELKLNEKGWSLSLQNIVRDIKVFHIFIRISTSSLQNHDYKLTSNILRSRWGKFVVMTSLHIILERIILERNG